MTLACGMPPAGAPAVSLSGDPGTPLRLAAENEAKYIELRRKLGGLPVGRHARVGLALSGGGIRSATFSLGVLQALSHHRLIRHLDYLSTVSGGSYIGSFFGALYVEPALRKLTDPDLADQAARKDFVERPLQSVRGRKAVARLREFGRYITPGGFSDMLFGVSLVARNWVALQLVLGVVPLLFFLVLRCASAAISHSGFSGFHADYPWLFDHSPTAYVLGGLAAARSTVASSPPVQLVAGVKAASSGLLVLLVVVAAIASAALSIGYWFSRREQLSSSVARRLSTNGPFLFAIVLAAAVGSVHVPSLVASTGNCLAGGDPAQNGPPCPGLQADLGTHLGPSLISLTLAAAALSYLVAIRTRRRDCSPEEAEEAARAVLNR